MEGATAGRETGDRLAMLDEDDGDFMLLLADEKQQASPTVDVTLRGSGTREGASSADKKLGRSRLKRASEQSFSSEERESRFLMAPLFSSKQFFSHKNRRRPCCRPAFGLLFFFSL